MKFQTIIKRFSKRPTIRYVRISGDDQDHLRQTVFLEKAHPELDQDPFIENLPGDTDPYERFKGILPHSIIVAEHPDRFLKTNRVSLIKDLVNLFLEMDFKVYINPKQLSVWKSLLYDCSYRSFLKMVKQRIIKVANPQASLSSLTEDQELLVKEVYRDLKKTLLTLSSWDLKFWATFAFMGYAVNLVLLDRLNPLTKADRSFGSQPSQVLLFSALSALEGKGLQRHQISETLSSKYGVTQENGKPLHVDQLSRYRNSASFLEFKEAHRKVHRSLSWLDFKPTHDLEPSIKPSSKKVRVALKKLGLSKLYPEQDQVLSALMKGLSVSYQTRTGGGKSLLPRIYSQANPSSLVVVVIPTNALIANMLTKWGLLGDQVLTLDQYSKTSIPGIEKALKKKNLRALLLTPNKLQDEDLRSLLKDKVDLLVIDEAHNLAYSGKVYRKEYRSKRIREAITQINPRTTLFTSATLDAPSRKQVSMIGDYPLISGSLRRPNLTLRTYHCSNRGLKMMILHQYLQAIQNRGEGKTIVYFNNVKDLLKAKGCFEELGFRIYRYFSGSYSETKMSTQDKKGSLDEFSRDSKGVMFATCAFGEGLDFPDVRLVVAFSMAGSIAELYQWIGRAGRDGECALGVQLLDPNGKILRECLIDFHEEDSVTNKFQTRRFEELLELLEEHPTPKMKHLIQRIKPKKL